MLAILVDEVEFFVADPTVAPILEDLAGWPVAVTSGVEERFTDRHFAVDGGLVLVVAPEPVTFEPGDFVLARGTAALFDREWVDEQVLAGLTEEDLDELDGRPLVIADHVEVLAGVDIRAE